MIERQIIIGLITSTVFLKKIRPLWQPQLLESSMARMLGRWVIEYYDKYKKAPTKEIEAIFYQKLKEGLDTEIADEIENDILPDLSDEYTAQDFDLEYLLDETRTYLKSRKLLILSEQIDVLVTEKKGNLQERIEEAEQLTNDFKLLNNEDDNSIDLSSSKVVERIQKAFKESTEPIIKWPKQLGEFWNEQFVRGAFISLLAPEKRGKTFLLLEIAMKAAKQGKKVAFFQAGDMNEAEQIKRIGIYLSGRSNLEKYCTEHYEPVRDCILNQIDKCDKKEREGDFGIFEDLDEKTCRLVEIDELIQARKDNSDYKTCYNCKLYNSSKLGIAFVKRVEKGQPIDSIDVERVYKQFFRKHKRRFKLSTHANGTLAFKKIENILDTWQDENGFIPDVIIIDYMDLMDGSYFRGDFRQQENQKWKDARKLSQTKRNGILPLLIAPTQADAKAYKTYLLQLDNFSEDKRKYAHVTAMYGLNQDPLGREKAIGLLRINQIIIREGEFSNNNQVTVLQNLRQGKPFKGSYF